MAYSEQVTAENASKLYFLYTQLGLPKNSDEWTPEQKHQVNAIFDKFDEFYGEQGPRMFRLAAEDHAAKTPEERLKIEKDMAATSNNLAAIAPVTPPPFPPSTSKGFVSGLEAGGGQFVPGLSEQTKQDLVKEAQLREQTNPIAVNVGKFVGSIVPAAALDYLIGKLPGGKVIEKMFPGKSFNAARAREALINTGPVATAAASGAILGGLNPNDTALSGAGYGAGGGVAGKFVGGVISKRASLRSPAEKDFVKQMEQEGFWANPGLKSGRRQEMMLDEAFRKNPNTAGQVQARLDHNQQLLNSKVAEGMGLPETTKQLDINTIIGQSDTLNRKLDDLYNSMNISFTPRDTLLTSQVKQGYQNVMGSSVPSDLKQLLSRYDFLEHSPNLTANQRRTNFRALISDVSRRLTFHSTNPNGNREAAAGLKTMYNNMLNVAQRSLGGNREALKSFKDTRGQLGFLYDLVDTDKGLLTSSSASAPALMKMYNKGKSKKLSYIEHRKDIFNAARFNLMQRDSFENSLSMNQRLGNYLHPKERSSALGSISDLAASTHLPLVSNIPVAMYLSRGSSHGLPAGTPDVLSALLGTYGAAGMPDLSFIPGLFSDQQISR